MTRTTRHKESEEAFVRLLTVEQPRLYGFILTLIANEERAQDVLQETNVVLWRKASTYREGSNFGAWSKKVAYHQALACRRDRHRDRHLFDDELVGQLARVAERRLDEVADRTTALRICVTKLTQQERDLLYERYSLDRQVKEIASRSKRSASSISNIFFSIRRQLLECIERTVRAEQRP